MVPFWHEVSYEESVEKGREMSKAALRAIWKAEGGIRHRRRVAGTLVRSTTSVAAANMASKYITT